MTDNLNQADISLQESRVTSRILFNAGTTSEMEVGGENIISMILDEVINTSDGINMGQTCSTKLTVELLVPEGLAFATATLSPYAKVEGIEYPLGRFHVCDAQTQNGYTTVTLECYDTFCRLEEEYLPSEGLVFPATLEQVIGDMVSQGLFQTDYSFEAYPHIYLDKVDGYSCRQVIGYVAGLMGQNARFGRDGKLTFSWYEPLETVISREEQYQNSLTLTTSDPLGIFSITSGSEEDVFTVGNGMGVTFENPYMTPELAQGILAGLEGFSYRPCTLMTRGDLGIEVGQQIAVQVDSNTTVTMCVMEQNILINGGMQAQITSYGKSEASASFEKETTTSIINRLSSRLEKTLMMTDSINNSRGGVFEVIDSNGDGTADSFVIRMADGSGSLLRANHEGIGFSNDGGNTYITALNQTGICTEAINTDALWAGQLVTQGLEAEDIISMRPTPQGDMQLLIGSSKGDVVLKQVHNSLGFYTNPENVQEAETLCALTPDSFTMKEFNTIKLGRLKLYNNINGAVVLSTGGTQ